MWVGPIETGYQSAWPRPIVKLAPLCGPRIMMGCDAAPSLGQMKTGSLLFCAAATLTGVLGFRNPLWSIASYSGFSSMNGKSMMHQLSPGGLQHGALAPYGSVLCTDS